MPNKTIYKCLTCDFTSTNPADALLEFFGCLSCASANVGGGLYN